MARFTKVDRVRVHITPTSHRMDDLGNSRRGLVATGRPRRRSGTDRLETPHRRWHVLPGKKGGALVAEGHKGKETTALVLMDNRQTPLGVIIAAANDHESRHIERLVDADVVPLPKTTHLAYDKAANSEPLRDRLAVQGITLIAPRRRNRKTKRTTHHRHNQRLKQRWKIERTNAWLHRYGRLAIRNDRRADVFLCWTQLACLNTILKKFRRRLSVFTQHASS